MAIAIPTKEEKAETVDLLRRILTRFLFPGVLRMDERDAILFHLDWIRRQKDLFVECRLTTMPALGGTKIELTITHSAHGPVKHDA